ncbi:MAG: TlpA disulfide reductase family protein [Pirellulales bacterium]
MTKQALEAYVDFAAAFAASSDPQVRDNAAALEGAARYLSLPGNAMDVKGKTVDGKDFDVKSWEGKVVLVDFWATWCGPCIAELPTLRECYEKYHDRGFEVVGISLDSDRKRLDDFLTREELPWTTLFSADESATGWKHPLAAKYGVMSIPRGVLIDRKGKVVSLDAHGEALWDLLTAQIGPAEVKKEADKEDAKKDAKPGAE